MSKVLVAYFSASGVTARMAKALADSIGADLHEIQPEVPYMNEDLNWQIRKAEVVLKWKINHFVLQSQIK